jgi:hypothetical protein
MRMTVGKVPESGLRWITTLDCPGHLLCCPVGGVRFFWKMPSTTTILIVTHTVIELASSVSLITKEQFIVVNNAILQSPLFIQNNIIKTDAVTLWIDMQLANGISLVPRKKSVP